jgi:hypothetical protein
MCSGSTDAGDMIAGMRRCGSRLHHLRLDCLRTIIGVSALIISNAQ